MLINKHVPNVPLLKLINFFFRQQNFTWYAQADISIIPSKYKRQTCIHDRRGNSFIILYSYVIKLMVA